MPAILRACSSTASSSNKHKMITMKDNEEERKYFLPLTLTTDDQNHNNDSDHNRNHDYYDCHKGDHNQDRTNERDDKDEEGRSLVITQFFDQNSTAAVAVVFKEVAGRERNIISCSSSSFSRLLWETIVVRFVASIILHAQSLYCVFVFDGKFYSTFISFLGAGLEGVCFISTIVSLMGGVRAINDNNHNRNNHCPSLNEKDTKKKICLLDQYSSLLKLIKPAFIVPSILSILWRICLIILLIPIAIGAIISDAGFQQKTGGERPDMWVILAHIKNFSSGAKAEFKDSQKGAWRLVLGSLTTVGLTCLMCLWHERRQRVTQLRRQQRNGTPKMTIILTLIGILTMITLYLSGAWMPIFHTYMSICGSFFLSPPGSKEMAKSLQIEKNPSDVIKSSFINNHNLDYAEHKLSRQPNVILVIHESLSGEVVMTSDTAVKAMPFFHSMLTTSQSGQPSESSKKEYDKSNNNDNNYFVFEHTRAVSGDTTDALTVMHSGCNPLDHKGKSRDYALNTTLATEFKKQGYDTVSFSSRGMTLRGTKWFMTQHQLETNFDQTYDPEVTKDSLVNPPGQDDRLMITHFRKWLGGRRTRIRNGSSSSSKENKQKNNRQRRRPFYAQFYLYNAHYPFFNQNENNQTQGSSSTSSKTTMTRLDGMLETVDQSIEKLFANLQEMGYLENTIVLGAGDHGEKRSSTHTKYGRLREWNRDILHSPMYLHMPQRLLQNDENYNTLRHNTQQLTSTLDIFPTIMHILNNNKILKNNGYDPRVRDSKRQLVQNNTNISYNLSSDYPVMDKHCARGINLFDTKILADRIAWSFPGVSNDISRGKQGNIALHVGTSSSLYHRFGWPQDNYLKILKYAPIINGKTTTRSNGDNDYDTKKKFSTEEEERRSSNSESSLSIEEWKDVALKIKEMTPESIIVTKAGSYIKDFYNKIGLPLDDTIT
mmetsp:Transcript_4547/g.5039  ORF Transcript_4547/g.5039 Transcript_4547/m.5039 type:complete len:940 (+) Transcript_4547:226-3045(+)|eukprot:CAMPEP_0194449696 /NCGR_PEP_ID=MMETSP0176-20130528/130297_1 /TAXON_ID=216777 /ORGANISM="Proboscia alata, Strain PI-D3" /LENGTH=939 /DNA_ID=CAMNT_0039276869 /DNA_START=168 /DNA_END=2987 /DNA_ORIENTATION=+